MHRVYDDVVGLSLPLLAVVQFVYCVISALFSVGRNVESRQMQLLLQAPPWRTHLTYPWRAKQVMDKTRNKRSKRLCTCVYVPISPSYLQPLCNRSNLSLYSMFALQHGGSSETREKQCACCIQSNKNR